MIVWVSEWVCESVLRRKKVRESVREEWTREKESRRENDKEVWKTMDMIFFLSTQRYIYKEQMRSCSLHTPAKTRERSTNAIKKNSRKNDMERKFKKKKNNIQKSNIRQKID